MWIIQTHECSTQHSHCTTHTQIRTAWEVRAAQEVNCPDSKDTELPEGFALYSATVSYSPTSTIYLQGVLVHVRVSAGEAARLCPVRRRGSIFPLKDSLYSSHMAGRNGAITSAMTQQMGLTLPHLLDRNEFPCMKWKRG